MQRALLRMSFPDRAALAQEHADNLKHGRAFVKDAEGIAALTDCTLELVQEADGSQLALAAQTVLVVDSGPMRGIGVQLRPFGEAEVARLEAFVSGSLPASAPVAAASDDESAAQPVAAAEEAADDDPLDPDTGDSATEASALENADEQDASIAANDGPDEGAETPADQQQQPARHERLRKLSLPQQHKIARTGDLNDRVTLERIYGKQVWESLLHNPKLTVPEVAGIARKGTIPRPLLEFIVENNMWIQAPIVRRALLGNPRTSGEAIMKLLRMTPKHELRAIHKTTTYSAQVREAARKALEL